MQLWDSHVPNEFLKIFGRPTRSTVCSCERVSEPNVAQVLKVMNSPLVQDKLRHAGGRVQAWAASPADNAELVREVYLTFLWSPAQQPGARSRTPVSGAADRSSAGCGRSGLEPDEQHRVRVQPLMPRGTEEFLMTQRPFCDRIVRRDMLRLGCAATAGFSLSLPQLLAKESAPQAAGRDVSVIIVFLHGGLSTIDTLDMKPAAPQEFRGEFNSIASRVPRMEVCEHLPLLAQSAQRFSLLRSFTHSNSDHGGADHYMLTGYRPTAAFNANLKPNNERPAHGAIIAKKFGPRGGVPPYVCVPAMHSSCGSSYLGSTCAPFVVEADPNSPGFQVPDLVPLLVVDASRLAARRDDPHSDGLVRRPRHSAACLAAEGRLSRRQRRPPVHRSGHTARRPPVAGP